MPRRIKKIFGFAWMTAGIIFFVWIIYSYQAKGFDNDIFNNSSSVTVKETSDFISFTPVRFYQKVFIFYPGALVDPKAYALLCRKIADSGYQSIIIKMSWRLASYGYNKPKETGLLKDTSKQFILAGHSKGAMMAAQFVYENPSLIDKLILLGTSQPKDFDLSTSTIPIMKIYASNDGVADTTEVNANKNKLPAATRYILIQGGNHAQFGYYGPQLGDNKASVSRAQQQEILLNNILSFIRQ